MTVAKIAATLLCYADQRSLSEALAAGSEYLEDVVLHINGAAQELFSEGPAYLRRRPMGDVLRAPVQISIADAVEDSATAGAITTHVAWMTGCTLRIEGHPDNRLLSYSGGVSTFLFPLPASGTLTATIYGDAIALPANTSRVLPRPELPGTWYLDPAQNEKDFRDLHTQSDYGRKRPGSLSQTFPTGTPCTYFIDPVLADGATQPQFYFRVLPLPERKFLLRYTAIVSPPTIVVADLDAAGNGAASTKTIPVPVAWIPLYFMPIALQRYTASPYFKNADAKEEIGRQYTAALKGLESSDPQSERFARFTPG